LERLGHSRRRNRTGGSNHDDRPTRAHPNAVAVADTNTGRNAKAGHDDHEAGEPYDNSSPFAPTEQTLNGALKPTMFVHHG